MKHPVKYGLKVSVEIVRDAEADSAKVIVHAPLYVNREWTMKHSYKSSEFSDQMILNDSDFTRVMFNHFSR
jgi:hypothetical protein